MAHRGRKKRRIIQSEQAIRSFVCKDRIRTEGPTLKPQLFTLPRIFIRSLFTKKAQRRHDTAGVQIVQYILRWILFIFHFHSFYHA